MIKFFKEWLKMYEGAQDESVQLIEFFFVSGESAKVKYSKKNLHELIECMKNAQTPHSITGSDYVILFDKVTHFTMKKYDPDNS